MASPNSTNNSASSNPARLVPIDVIVVGAGMAGLTAGIELIKDGHNVEIIEARDRVGGRIEAHNWSTGSIDLGASFVHGIDGNPLLDLLKEYDQPIHHEEKKDPIKIYSSKGEGFSDQQSKVLYEHANKTFFTTARNYAQSALLPGPPPPSSVHAAAAAAAPQPNSLYDFLLTPHSPLLTRRPVNEKVALQEIINSLDSWTGAPSQKVALRWWGFESEYMGDDVVLPKTYYKLVCKMAAEFQRLGGRIFLQSEVERIQLHCPSGQIRVRITGQTDEREAGCCVCTLPLGVLKAKGDSLFDPALPPRRLQAIARTGFGLLNKVIVRYEKAWWPVDTRWFIFLPDEAVESGSESSEGARSGSSLSTRPSSADEWPSPAVSGTSHTGSTDDEHKVFSKGVKVQNYIPITGEPVLVFYFGADAGEAVERLSSADVSELVHKKLRAVIPLGEWTLEHPEPPLECLVTRWRSDPYARGSYSFMQTSACSGFEDEEDSTPVDLKEMSKPLWNGKLGFAGEHCSMDHYACVHGPYMTGLDEAKRIRDNYHHFNDEQEPAEQDDQSDVEELETKLEQI